MIATRTILSFQSALSAIGRRALQKNLVQALRFSESPVIVDLTGCSTLNQRDIDVVLDCVAQGAGRDTPLFFVAGSRVIKVLLDVIRVSSLVPVFNSLEEALLHPKTVAWNFVEDAQLAGSHNPGARR